MRHIKWFSILLFLLIVSCYRGYGLSPPGNISGIEGRITFVGEWPDSTKEVWVVVLKNYPAGITEENELFQFVLENFVDSTAMPLFVNQYDYQMTLDPGFYGWVLVAWFPDIETWFLGVKELGAYYLSPGLQIVPTSIKIDEGVMVDGVDIIADFSNIDRELPFFKERGNRDKTYP